jgi:hypothetical protein
MGTGLVFMEQLCRSSTSDKTVTEQIAGTGESSDRTIELPHSVYATTLRRHMVMTSHAFLSSLLAIPLSTYTRQSPPSI